MQSRIPPLQASRNRIERIGTVGRYGTEFLEEPLSFKGLSKRLSKMGVVTEWPHARVTLGKFYSAGGVHCPGAGMRASLSDTSERPAT